MPKRKLTQIVDELTEHLDTTADIDDNARAALREAADAIQSALASEEPMDSRLLGLRERLERFESEHPRVTEIVSRLVNQLSDLGI